MSRARDIASIGSDFGSLATDVDVATAVSEIPTGGKNLIYNGAMQVAQRGTSFTNPATGYHLDRWRVDYSSGTVPCVITQSSFAAGESAGEGWPEKYLDVAWTATASKNIYIGQRIEDVRSAGGTQVTLSFYAKANAAVDVSARVVQNFGSGGSALTVTDFGVAGSLTTSWARYSHTFTVPSVSGKTIGSSSYLQADLFWPTDSTGSVDVWGVQLEVGPVATEFEFKSFGQELRECQRYYQRPGNRGGSGNYGVARAQTSTFANVLVHLPVSMRVTPSAIDFSTVGLQTPGISTIAATAITVDASSSTDSVCAFGATVASGLSTGTWYIFSNNSGGYFGFSAEL